MPEQGEPAAEKVRELLQTDDDARLTAVGVVEVVDHLVRLVGVSEDDAALDVAELGLGIAEPVDASIGLRTGVLQGRHHQRRDRAVSLADCIAAETARANDAALVTSDPHLLDLCDHEGIEVIALPDSSGEIGTP